MEDQMKEVKKTLSKGELADFVFTEQMRKNVLQKTKNYTGRKKSESGLNFFPRSLSLAAVLLFSAGIYYIVNDGLHDPGRNAGPDIIQPKPVLVTPSYIPTGYIYKQTHTNRDIDEHIYVKESNEDDYFTYGMQETKPEESGTAGKEIWLTDNLTGIEYEIANGHHLLLWKDEGLYQSVEHSGDLSEIEFYKVVDSILEGKGYKSLLKQHISELEEAKKAEEEKQAMMAFDEEKALALLKKYEATINEAFGDANENNNYKFDTYKTKEDFYALFTDFVSRYLVESTFGFMVEEKADGLYVQPTEGPHTFWRDIPFEFEKVSDTEYKLTQIQEGDLNGKQNIIFTFKFNTDKWMIDSIEIIQL